MLFTILFLLSLLMLVLIVPVKYHIVADKGEKITGTAKIVWLFGSVHGSLGYDSQSGTSNNLTIFGKTLTWKKEWTFRNKNKSEWSRKLYRNRELIQSFIELIFDIIRWLKPEKYKLNCIIGFDDPWITGIASGISYTLQIPDLKINWSFEEAVLEGNFIIEGRVIIGGLVFNFLFSKLAIVLLKNWLKQKKGEVRDVGWNRKSCEGKYRCHL